MHDRKEREFETGMDEAYKQTAHEATGQRSTSMSREDDRAIDYNSTLQYQYVENKLKTQALDLAEREMSLTERKNRESERALAAQNREAERAILVANRESSTHMANLKMNDHYSLGYDKQLNLEAVEGRSNALVLEGEAGISIRAAIAAEVQRQLTRDAS